MAHVTIYTRPFCGYCARALSVLSEKGADFTEIEAGMDPALRQEMMQRSPDKMLVLDATRLKSLRLEGIDPAYEKWLRENVDQPQAQPDRQ